MSNQENQSVEWKESWRDDYLKWICGFANAQGGVLVIGKHDQGHAIGVAQRQKLLEELPNKIRDLLGIVAEVNALTEAGAELLEIKIEPYPYPISYRGKYYLRSGSTLQELKGATLDRFLLRKQGRTWDSVPVPQLKAEALSESALGQFRKRAAQSGRLDKTVLQEALPELLEKLMLVDGNYLKRAAGMVFLPEPEQLVAGAFVKIGFFRSESELLYHDEVRGDLFSQVLQTLTLLQTKYLKAAISYEGIQRVETFPVPEDALREALLNAMIHKDYASHAPIQIRVYANKLKIWNAAELPENWTLKKLLGEHPSRPFNPTVANVFFRAGEIEVWGRGIERIFEACRLAACPKPKLRYEANDLWVEFPFSKTYLTRVGEKTHAKTPVKMTAKTPVKTPDKILQILHKNPDLTLAEVAEQIDKSLSAVERASSKLVKAGRLKYSGPKKGGHWEVIE